MSRQELACPVSNHVANHVEFTAAMSNLAVKGNFAAPAAATESRKPLRLKNVATHVESFDMLHHKAIQVIKKIIPKGNLARNHIVISRGPL
ncbi:hypothetical protein M8J76_009040 [Diaphorina citri]|nr:hypothetical protein M8J76_009040 [Diaphorina citri]